MQEHSAAGADGLGYLVLALAMNVVIRVYLMRDLWVRVLRLGQCASASSAAANVAAQGRSGQRARRGICRRSRCRRVLAHELMTMDSDAPEISAARRPADAAIYFDGTSSRRRAVTLRFRRPARNQRTDEQPLAAWAYADIRRADSPSGMLRLSCLTAPALARLEIRDAALATELVSRCARLDENTPGRRGVAADRRLVARGGGFDRRRGAVRLPLAADRLAPLVPERSNGGSAMSPTAQIKTMFGAKVCDDPAGQAAFVKLVTAIARIRRPRPSVQSARAVDPDSQCLRAAGRQGLSVRRTAGEGRQPRRDRRRAGARTRPSQASRQHARADPQRRHVVPDRAAVRRHHRLRAR